MEPDLQSEDSILKLMWMASEAGEAFPEAVVAAVAPVLRATSRADRSIVDHLSDERAELYRRHPLAASALLDALVHPDHPSRNLSVRLDGLLATDPALFGDPRFERLRRLAGSL